MSKYSACAASKTSRVMPEGMWTVLGAALPRNLLTRRMLPKVPLFAEYKDLKNSPLFEKLNYMLWIYLKVSWWYVIGVPVQYMTVVYPVMTVILAGQNCCLLGYNHYSWAWLRHDHNHDLYLFGHDRYLPLNDHSFFLLPTWKWTLFTQTWPFSTCKWPFELVVMNNNNLAMTASLPRLEPKELKSRGLRPREAR